MSGEAPRCRRERLTVDLNDPAQRSALYKAAGSAPALMITEGLLLYLPASTVEALAAFSKLLGGGTDTMKPIRHMQASDALKGEQILEVVERNGWKMSAMRSYITDVGFVRERVRRAMGGAEPPQRPYPRNDPTGVHRFGRT